MSDRGTPQWKARNALHLLTAAMNTLEGTRCGYRNALREVSKESD